jgi:hypothetical protein
LYNIDIKGEHNMTKVTPILERCIQCPKCQKKTMRRSLPQVVGKEWFCDQCHIYMGTEELILQWDYDYGDFNDVSYEEIWNINSPIEVEDVLVSTNWFDTVSTFQIDEPQFKSAKECDEAYEMVDRMFLDIPEWSEGCSNQGIDIGLGGYPI